VPGVSVEGRGEKLIAGRWDLLRLRIDYHWHKATSVDTMHPLLPGISQLRLPGHSNPQNVEPARFSHTAGPPTVTSALHCT